MRIENESERVATHNRYWLPSLLKHEYVALRFVAQSSYEKAAQMRISPTPDVVTRVFHALPRSLLR